MKKEWNKIFRCFQNLIVFLLAKYFIGLFLARFLFDKFSEMGRSVIQKLLSRLHLMQKHNISPWFSAQRPLHLLRLGSGALMKHLLDSYNGTFNGHQWCAA